MLTPRMTRPTAAEQELDERAARAAGALRRTDGEVDDETEPAMAIQPSHHVGRTRIRREADEEEAPNSVDLFASRLPR